MVSFSALRAGAGAATSAARRVDPSMFKNLSPEAIRKLDVSSLGDIASKLPSDQLKRVTGSLNPQQLGDLVKRLDDIQLRRLTNNMDPGKLSDVLKNLDPGTLKRVTRNTDPQKLLQSLKNIRDPAALKRVTDAMDPDVLKKVADLDPKTFSQFTGVDLKQLNKRVKAAARKAPNRGKNIPKKAPEEVLDAADPVEAVAKKSGLSRVDAEDAAKNTGDMVKNSPPALEAVSKLGFLKKMGGSVGKFTARNWLKIGGAVFLLCLMYDTDNPFTALSRATKDAGVTIRGLKDAAFDLGAGLGGLIELLTSIPQFLMANSGASFACCLCIIAMMVISSMR